MVEPNKTGFIVSPTPQAVAQSIAFLLDQPAEACAMGERGRERAMEHFSEPVYLAKLTAVFIEAAQNTAETPPPVPAPVPFARRGSPRREG